VETIPTRQGDACVDRAGDTQLERISRHRGRPLAAVEGIAGHVADRRRVGRDTDQQLTVANTHLSFVPGWNRCQLRRLSRDLRGLPGPRILTGDLNLTTGPAQRWSGLRSLATAFTFPAESPSRQLDHVLTDDGALRACSCATPHLPISDHRPLVVRLQAG
jgi:endonuclease/exonuclease/phosphatase family metal-dependent hydrolase